MKRPGDPDNGTPLWVVFALLAILGITFSLSGYLIWAGQ